MNKIYIANGEMRLTISQKATDEGVHLSASFCLEILGGQQKIQLAGYLLPEALLLLKKIGGEDVDATSLTLRIRDLERQIREQQAVIHDLISPEGDGPNARTYQRGYKKGVEDTHREIQEISLRTNEGGAEEDDYL